MRMILPPASLGPLKEAVRRKKSLPDSHCPGSFSPKTMLSKVVPSGVCTVITPPPRWVVLASWTDDSSVFSAVRAAAAACAWAFLPSRTNPSALRRAPAGKLGVQAADAIVGVLLKIPGRDGGRRHRAGRLAAFQEDGLADRILHAASCRLVFSSAAVSRSRSSLPATRRTARSPCCTPASAEARR